MTQLMMLGLFASVVNIGVAAVLHRLTRRREGASWRRWTGASLGAAVGLTIAVGEVHLLYGLQSGGGDAGTLIEALLFTFAAPSAIGIMAWLGGEFVGGRPRKSWGGAVAACLATGLAIVGEWLIGPTSPLLRAVTWPINLLWPCLAAVAGYALAVSSLSPAEPRLL